MTRNRTSRRSLLAGTAVAVLALVAACGGGEPAAGPTSPEPTASAATTAPATPSPAPTPAGTTGPADEDAQADATAPEFGTPSADAEPSADASLTVTGLRSGAQLGYDRVVVDLAGTGTPGWHIERTATAVEDPTGDAVDLGGDGVLSVYVTGLGYPYETGQTELAVGTRISGPTVVTGAEYTGTFEGQAQVFLGLTDPEAPYRAFLLQDPLRLVIDVQRSMA
jgi:hypothetical protein